MRRYLLFAGASYYASGGWKDFIGSFHAESDARAKAEELVGGDEYRDGAKDWAHVVDTQNLPHGEFLEDLPCVYRDDKMGWSG